ncbi:MAG: hypothetical protein QXP53_00705 [Candidatus Pacearchaeota archaeon]
MKLEKIVLFALPFFIASSVFEKTKAPVYEFRKQEVTDTFYLRKHRSLGPYDIFLKEILGDSVTVVITKDKESYLFLLKLGTSITYQDKNNETTITVNSINNEKGKECIIFSKINEN